MPTQDPTYKATDKEAYAEAVGKRVKQLYRHDDGDDLCFNLMEQINGKAVINSSMPIDTAAFIVAQHLEQP